MDGYDFAIYGTLPNVFLHPIIVENWNRSHACQICTNSRTHDKIIEKLLLNRVHPLIDPSLDECHAGFRWGSNLQAYLSSQRVQDVQAFGWH